MKRTLLYLHVAFVLGGYLLLALAWVWAPRAFRPESVWILVGLGTSVMAAMGSITGMREMISRRGQQESIALALTTIAAFVLLLLTCPVRF